MTTTANPAALDMAAGAAEPAQINCAFCDELVSAKAKKCRHCGETLDVGMRKAEEALRASERGGGNVYMNAAVSAPSAPALTYNKSKVVAAMLALFLGGLGVHKFYLSRPMQGLLYLVFCWTFIPSILAFIEAIIYLFSDDDSFARKYG